MRIVYVTTDDVNTALAEQFAARCGLALEHVDVRSARPQQGQTLVLDLDYLPADRCQELLTAVLAQPGGQTAVHGYNLPPGRSRQLRQAGVIAQRRLTAGLFRQLQPARRLSRKELEPASSCD